MNIFDDCNYTDPAPLEYPAPKRCWEKTEHGFCSHRWTIDDVVFAQSGGAWFSPDAGHEFDCMATRKFALYPELAKAEQLAASLQDPPFAV